MSKDICFTDVQKFKEFCKENPSRCYLKHNNSVYDITDYLDEHPGGPQSIEDYKSQDITEVFNDDFYHDHSENALRTFQKFKIGFIKSEK